MIQINIHRINYRIISIILALSLALSLLSGCGGKNVASSDVATATDSSYAENTATPGDAAVVSVETTEKINTAKSELLELSDNEAECVYALSEAINEGSIETAKEELQNLSNAISEADEKTAEWTDAQAEASEELKENISEEAQAVLNEREEAFNEQMEENREKTEGLLAEIEESLDSGDTETAGVKADELKQLMNNYDAVNSYGVNASAGESVESAYYNDTASSAYDGDKLLALTGETEINEDVMWLAEELGTPLEIYNYLKNSLDYEYYYGSRKGANGTYATMSGNDYDQASLLIGMLRYMGYRAEYVKGEIYLEEDMALSLTGADNLYNAADVLAASGMPVTRINQNGETVRLKIEHVWVRAEIPYSDYRGAGNAGGSYVWLDLDTCIKEYEEVFSIYDIFEETGMPEGMGDAAGSGDVETTVDILDSYIESVSQNYDEEVYARKRIIKQEYLSYLPASLQYETIGETETFSAIESGVKDSVSFEAGGESLGTYSTSYLEGKSVVLTFLPAESIDEEILNGYSSIFDVPAYSVYVRPALIIDDEVVAEAEYVETTLGAEYDFTMVLNDTGNEVKTITNSVTAGSMYAVTIDGGMISGDALWDIYYKIEDLQESVTEQNVYSAKYLGNYLALAGKLYFAQTDTFDIIAGEQYNVSITKGLSEGITGYEVEKTGRYGIVTGISYGSLYIDIDSNTYSVKSLTADETSERMFMLSSGMMSSMYEGLVWEQLTGEKGISTVSIFAQAYDEDIELLGITKDNVEEQLEKLNTDDETKQAVKEAAESGMVVTIPERDVTMGDWTGTGYIVTNPETGEGSYMISGGYNGGVLDFIATMSMIVSFLSISFDTAITIGVVLNIMLSVSGITAMIAFAGYVFLVLVMNMLVMLDVYDDYQSYKATGDADYVAAALAKTMVNTAFACISGAMAADDLLKLFKNGSSGVGSIASIVSPNFDMNKLTRSQKNAIDSADNIINDHLKNSDLAAALSELQGKPIPKPNGGYWNHIKEVKDAYAGLIRARNTLSGSLKNPNLETDVRVFIQSKYDVISEYINIIEKLFAPYGGVN